MMTQPECKVNLCYILDCSDKNNSQLGLDKMLDIRKTLMCSENTSLTL